MDINVFSHLLALPTSTAFQAISRFAATTLITAVWQSAVIAGILTITLRLIPGISASVRFTLWAAAFLLMLLLPFLPLAVAHCAAQSGSQAAHPLLLFDVRWSIAIVALWACATIYRIASLARNAWRLRQVWKTAQPVQNHSSSVTEHVRAAQICTTRQLDRPAVIGFLAPRILIPEWLFARLSPSELDQIVLHETEHLRRHDDWTNLLQKLSLVLFPLNPALWWIEHKLCLEREMACDDGVIRRTKSPRAYATCLTDLAERSLHHTLSPTEALSLGAWQRRPELTQRVYSILKRQPKLHPVATTALLALVTSGLVAGSVELARCPQLVTFASPLASQPLAQIISPDSRSHLVQTSFSTDRKNATSSFHPVLATFKSPLPLRQSNLLPAHTVTKRTFKAPQTKGLRATPPLAVAQNVTFRAEDQQPDSSTQESWLVLTTWEQTTALPTEQPSSQATLTAASSEHVNSSTVAPEPIYQTTVTRMIFRIVPARYTPQTPALNAARSGWLVFHL